MRPLIYIAEDVSNIRNLIVSFLKKEDYEVEEFETGDALFARFEQQAAHLVILDVMMPGSSGFEICQKIRAFSNVPILFLTARDSEEDFAEGINLGSDAYLTKPFSPVKLVLQVKAMLRRVAIERVDPAFPAVYDVVQLADLSVNINKVKATCKNELLNLTQTEFELLTYLLKNQARAVSRQELLSSIWGYTEEIKTRAIDDSIKRLRKKLKEAKSSVKIETIRGFGFSIEGGVIDEEII